MSSVFDNTVYNAVFVSNYSSYLALFAAPLPEAGNPMNCPPVTESYLVVIINYVEVAAPVVRAAAKQRAAAVARAAVDPAAAVSGAEHVVRD